MAVIVIAEHDTACLRPATRSAVTAARRFADMKDGVVAVLIAGHGCAGAAAAAARLAGVDRVLAADDPALAHGLAEPLAATIEPLAADFDTILAPATTFGKNVMPRLAARLDVQQVSEVSAIIDAQTFVRPVYAGNALATVVSRQAKNVITVRATSFEATPDIPRGGAAVSIETVAAAADPGLSAFVGREESGGERPELTSARVVISGGRGLGSAENFKLLEPIADRLGAAIGASRAAVDAGYVPNDWQVGQTGKVVAPDLYIAVGISGAIQHLAGMKDSKVIVAINKDEDAPIFQVADYGLVADLFEVMPALVAALAEDT